MPDTLTVYGQAPGIVDVLANDLDPAGGLLVVQRASATGPTSSTWRSSTGAGCASPRPPRPRPGRRPSPTRSATAPAPPRAARWWSPSVLRRRTTPHHGLRQGRGAGRRLRRGARARQRRVPGRPPRPCSTTCRAATPRPARRRGTHRRHRRRRQGLRVRAWCATSPPRRSRSATPTPSPTSRRTSRASAPTAPSR